jgi:hypothetical protein
MKRALSLLLMLLAFVPEAAIARSHGGHSRSAVHHSERSYRTRAHRDHGTRKRDPAQRRKFERRNPCPSTGRTSGKCPGYVVDHIKPLKRGGADRPSNMQWQMVAAAKAKDKWE